MFPLLKRNVSGYHFSEPTFYSEHHLGTDYQADNDPLIAPFSGTILESFWGVEGGLTIWLKPNSRNVVIRFLHLSKSMVTKGQKVVAGELIAVTGNTGKLTKGPHLHLDISVGSVVLAWPGNFIDPEKYNWDDLPVSTDNPFARTDPSDSRPNGYVQTRTVGRVNVRNRFDRLEDADIVEVLEGDVVQDVSGVVEGISVGGNSKWFVKPNGLFIWTGGTTYDGTNL